MNRTVPDRRASAGCTRRPSRVSRRVQQGRVREINRRYYGARRALTERAPGHGASDPAVRASLTANLERMLAEERAVLTPAQLPPFDRNLAEVRANWARVDARRRATS